MHDAEKKAEDKKLYLTDIQILNKQFCSTLLAMALDRFQAHQQFSLQAVRLKFEHMQKLAESDADRQKLKMTYDIVQCFKN